MNYKDTSIYKKIPRVARNILDTYESDRDINVLFDAIKAHVDTYSNPSTAYVRISEFRSLLKKYFNLTPDDLIPIQQTKTQTEDYNKALFNKHQSRRELTVSVDIFNRIMGLGVIPELLCRSGLRINELLNNVDIRNGRVYVQISKKRLSNREASKAAEAAEASANTPVEVFILGKTRDWIAKYEDMNPRNVKHETLVTYVNKNLKLIIPAEFPKRSSHICRALYARFIYQFLNKSHKQFFQITREFLHHNSDASSNSYTYLVLDPAIGDTISQSKYDEGTLNEMKSTQLTALLKAESVKGRSKYKTKSDKIRVLLTIE